ncbi:MAG: glycerophosphodiester phosphodiesterase [Acidimicrobiales bacterium]
MVRVIAHRGASVAEPENSIAAFAAAGRLGAHGVELDVRRSRDHAAVVHHDANLADGRLIAELTVADLPDGVPLLGAAIDACEGMMVNIEIKNVSIDPDYDPDNFLVAAVAAIVNDRARLDDVLVSSFNWDTVDLMAGAEPALGRAYLTVPNADQHRAIARLARRGHQAIHPHHLAVNAEMVAAAHDAGIEVNVWTVDDPDRMRWLAEAGVDGIVTNVPDVALAALAAG